MGGAVTLEAFFFSPIQNRDCQHETRYCYGMMVADATTPPGKMDPPLQNKPQVFCMYSIVFSSNVDLLPFSILLGL